MSDHEAHQSQIHNHGPGCGHLAVAHGAHEDYLHDGKLFHRGEKSELHALEVNERNPARCTPSHACNGHAPDHEHGPSCGHVTVPHGDHHDYLVDGHLHHPCDKHCDDHGKVEVSVPPRRCVRRRGSSPSSSLRC